MAEELKNYIETLSNKGKTSEEIKQILLSAGWDKKDVGNALSEFSGMNFGDIPPPPPPPKRESHSMVQISINFLSFVLLGFVATRLGMLYFNVIDKYFPDPLFTGRFTASVIHYSIAALFVAFPIYLWTICFWFRGFAQSPERQESRLTKWLTYIVLLIAAGLIIGDLVFVIFNFLQGELSLRFILKALTVLVIAGLIFLFYFLERKKIQYRKEIAGGIFKTLATSTATLVVVGMVVGFLASGGPTDERLRRFDEERVEDLTKISYAISDFALENDALPNSLEEIQKNPRYFVTDIVDPVTREEYQYSVISEETYKLCAVFSFSTLDMPTIDSPYPESVWNMHDDGEVCNEQNVTFGDTDTAPLLHP